MEYLSSVPCDHNYVKNPINIVCTQCGKPFRHRGCYNEHYKRHSREKRHVCKFCNKKFYTKSDLHCHSVVNHDKKTKYYCKQCGSYWITQDMYVEHMRTHSGEKRLYNCVQCDKKYKTIAKFKVHRALHFERKLQGCCQVCLRSFTNIRILLAHKCMVSDTLKEEVSEMKLLPVLVKIEKVEDETSMPILKQVQKPLKLKQVARRTRKKNNYKVHETKPMHVFMVKKEKSVKNLYSCNVCDQSFSSQKKLRSHVKLCSSGEKRPLKFSCQICGKQYRYGRLLDQHRCSGKYDEKIPTCKNCGKTFKSKSHYQRHTENAKDCQRWTNHNKKKNFSCSKCGKKFVYAQSLNFHRKYPQNCEAVLKKRKSIECMHCDRLFSSEWALQKHIISYSKTKNFECVKCEEKFKYHANLHEHYRQNPECGEGQEFPKFPYEPENLMCEVCGKVGFRNRSEFNYHCRSHTDDCICKKCGMQFARLQSVTKHQQEACMGDKECSRCGAKGFPSKQSYFKHMNDHDVTFRMDMTRQGGSHKCEKCGDTFGRKLNLKNHQKHVCVGGIVCEFCGKADFKNKKEYRKHMVELHDPNYSVENELDDTVTKGLTSELMCSVCFRSFNTKTSKARHVLTSHRTKNPVTGEFDFHPCDRCRKLFNSPEELECHRIKTHSIACKFCGKYFMNRSIATHLRTHTGETPYSCGTCGKQFKSQTNLRYHKTKQNCSQGSS